MACDDLFDAMGIVRDLAYGPEPIQPLCDFGHEVEDHDLAFFRDLQKKAERLMQRKQWGCQEVFGRKPERYIKQLESALWIAVKKLDEEIELPESLLEALDLCNAVAADYYGNGCVKF